MSDSEHRLGEFVANYDPLTAEEQAMEPQGMAELLENSTLVSKTLSDGTTIEFEEGGDVKQCSYANSYRAVIEGMQIAADHQPNGLESMGFGTEHDELYLYLDEDQVHPTSENGLRLQRLGWFYAEERGSWMMFT